MSAPHVTAPMVGRKLASAPLPTRWGAFECMVYEGVGVHGDDAPREHVVMLRGDLRGVEGALVRIHSECLTSEVMGSLKCDCREQLERALQAVAAEGVGAVIYLRQEGRGIGLAAKIRAYALQAEGVDTVDANRALGLPDDARRYEAAAEVLGLLGVRSVRLLTNNPAKAQSLEALGVQVVETVPVVVAPTAWSGPYLEAKRLRMDHSLPAHPLPVID